MCHIILFMPVLGLGVFWIWPIEIAGPVYAVILLLSVILYAIIIQTMHTPVTTGSEGLRDAVGIVIEGGKRECLVQIRNEIWKAASKEPLGSGERVTVIGSRGLILQVQRYTNQTKGVPSHEGI